MITDFERGEWETLNRILNLINTLEDKVVSKKVFYHMIMDLRPKGDTRLRPLI